MGLPALQIVPVLYLWPIRPVMWTVFLRSGARIGIIPSFLGPNRQRRLSIVVAVVSFGSLGRSRLISIAAAINACCSTADCRGGTAATST